MSLSEEDDDADAAVESLAASARLADDESAPDALANDEGLEEAFDDEDGEGGHLDLEGDLEINDQVFEELHLGPEIVSEVQSMWIAYIKAAESKEAAGEAIYSAVFDSAPSLQSLFKTPRAVMAMRFMNGLHNIVNALDDPAKLKVVVETLGFQHMEFEVTVPRIIIFRDAITDLLAMELGERFSDRAQRGFQSILNYVGGAYIYVRLKYTDRLHILAASWAIVNKKSISDDDEEPSSSSSGEAAKEKQELEANAADNEKMQSGEKTAMAITQVPTTFTDMFVFNAAVMGYARSNWMNEVLTSFDSIVTYMSNSYRFQEECDVLGLRLAKYKGTIVLNTYKAVMLASMRSLCREWSPDHEVAWSWLWDNVERTLSVNMGKPASLMRALDKLWSSLETKDQDNLRKDIFTQFFAIAPAGQDFFKQSTTRLHFIADRVVSLTLDIYKDPTQVVEDLSALGLRHVGYAIPTEMFGPFTTACIQVVRGMTEDDVAVEAFRWSVNLISRILCRVISEGSTIVMRAINSNSGKKLRKAVACAPRGKRSLWMLSVQVGTQSISPLVWAIETGSHDAAKAMIKDLLTIRADRDRYYYGMDILFERHPDIVTRLCADAPALLPSLLDGLVWRSRFSENGYRRVNYFLKHLIVDTDGQFSKCLSEFVEHGDPKIICHPILVMVTDIAWNRLAFRAFLSGKSWFLLTLFVFITAQAVIKHLHSDTVESETERVMTFVCRCFIYNFSMGQWIYYHVKHAYRDIRAGLFFRFIHLPFPAYLQKWQDCVSLMLTLFLVFMFGFEPILMCITHSSGDFPGAGHFTQSCPGAEGTRFIYSVFSMCSMMMYFLLLIDLSVFSTRISAFVLMIFRVLSEVGLFLFALAFFLLAFACGVSSLETSSEEFAGIPSSGLGLLKVTFGMMSGPAYDALQEEEALFGSVFVYTIMTSVFLVNMLVAQLNSEYQCTYEDMVGFARLNRSKIVIESMPSVPKKRWARVLGNLYLDEPCEFGEGDVGLPGGIQELELASVNPTTVDTIRRFGGSTSVKAQWPKEEADKEDEDRFGRMERLLDRAMRKMKRQSKGGGGGTGAGSSSGGSAFSSGSGSVMSMSENGSM